MSSSELQAIQQAQGEGKVELASAGQRTVQIVLPNGRALDRTGTLDFSDTVVDPATGSVSLRATVPNADRTLLPGTFVTLRATLGEQLQAQTAQLEAEKTRMGLTDLRFQNGVASSFDVLDAQRSLFTAQQAVVQVQALQLQNLVTLYKVLGGGWTEAAAEQK